MVVCRRETDLNQRNWRMNETILVGILVRQTLRQTIIPCTWAVALQSVLLTTDPVGQLYC